VLINVFRAYAVEKSEESHEGADEIKDDYQLSMVNQDFNFVSSSSIDETFPGNSISTYT
jgi:hypothetical protein